VTAYLTNEQLKATLELTGTTFAEDDVTAAIEAASRGIEGACNRRFYPDSDANQVRHYTPQTGSTCLIDDLITLTSLKVDRNGDGTYEETWTLNQWFVLEPNNADSDGRPWTRATVNLVWGRALPPWPRSVEVTGKFGWAAVPGAIVEAVTILATQLLRRAREAPFGVVAIGMDVGAVTRLAVTDPSVRFLVADYQRERPSG
jgi:hypothetical protein